MNNIFLVNLYIKSALNRLLDVRLKCDIRHIMAVKQGLNSFHVDVHRNFCFCLIHSEDAMEYSKEFVTSVVLGKDLVPR